MHLIQLFITAIESQKNGAATLRPKLLGRDGAASISGRGEELVYLPTLPGSVLMYANTLRISSSERMYLNCGIT